MFQTHGYELCEACCVMVDMADVVWLLTVVELELSGRDL